MIKYCSLTAVFTPIPVKFILTIESRGSGSTNPGSGSYDGDVIVTALSAKGGAFKHWELNGVDVGSANPYTVTMSKNNALRAVFDEVASPEQLLSIGLVAVPMVATVVFVFLDFLSVHHNTRLLIRCTIKVYYEPLVHRVFIQVC
jgi:Flp pilus assembly protein TadG